jgi:hypothetical protein
MAKKKVSTAEETVHAIRCQDRKKYSGEENIRIVLEGPRREPGYESEPCYTRFCGPCCQTAGLRGFRNVGQIGSYK